MKLFNMNKMPDNKEYKYGTIEELSEWDKQELAKLNIDAAFYWYAYGKYEGDGQMIMYKDGKWDSMSLGHCSCYGPCDRLSFNGVADTLDELQEKHSNQYWDGDLAELAEFAKSKGYN